MNRHPQSVARATKTLSFATALVMFVATLLGACSPPWSERQPVAGGDGTTWWMIRCHRDDAGCLQQAHEACPLGYDIKERDGRKFYLIACRERASQGARKATEPRELRPSADAPTSPSANAPADDGKVAPSTSQP